MFHPDDTIGPYTLIRTLGRGAFGEVWLAEKCSALLTTQVALKMPLVAENDVETVRGEAALWLRASGHPNIVPVLDADIYDGQVVIASEFISGGSLHEWMQVNGGQASPAELAVAITDGILAGLDYLHRVGLNHRDLKPENVLLQDGIPRLTDFGLARVLKMEAQTSTISGTPRYMAPETFSGSYSTSSDLWAVGIILYELLTATQPFPTRELMALIVAIQSQEPAALPVHIPERLRSIVTRLLAKSPSERYPSASAVREALQNCLQTSVATSLAVADAPVLPPNNLPVQTTSFVGREKERGELAVLLRNSHLVALTGSGGCGKTRLCLEVAADVLDRFSDGVWLVELAPLADAALVPQTVADILGIREAPGETITRALLMGLKDKQLLLVLDNCEHLLDAVARLVDEILRTSPKVRLVVSSREALGIAGESAYRLPSLSLPDLKQPQTPQSVSRYDSVRLFIDRAIAVKKDFAVTTTNAPLLCSVCQRLDGIPLAIELAAARVRSMPVEQIEARLHDRFRLLTGGSRTALPRQQTLRALIQWSVDLLNNREKALLLRLSVFTGGWSLEAAEKVCAGAEIEEWEMLDLLTAQVDKSLVVYEEQRGEARYRLLETVRHYAMEMLAESGEGETYRRRHRDYFLALAEEGKVQINGPEQALWLGRLEMEHDNLRQALTFCLADPDGAEPGLLLGSALQRFWSTRGYLSEGRDHLTALLARPEAQARTPARAAALLGAGALSCKQCDYAGALALIYESLDIMRYLGDRHGIAICLLTLGNLYSDEGNFAGARSMYEQSLEINRDNGDLQNIAICLNNLGSIATDEADYDFARTCLEESLELRRELGDSQRIAITLAGLGVIAYGQGDYTSARALIAESLAIARELGHKEGIAQYLESFAGFNASQGKPGQAARLWAAAARIREEIGTPLAPKERNEYERNVAATRQALGEDAFAAAWAQGRVMTMEQAIEYALSDMTV